MRDAVARAIAEGRALARSASDELLAAADAVRPASTSDLFGGSAGLADAPAAALLDTERTLSAKLVGELRELARRQLDDTDTFNTVLFGRTGAGKSSMLEAISHGAGATISPGESDWTTAIKPVDWASCQGP